MEQTNIKGYKKTCPICNKEFFNTNKKQLEWNFKIHYESCKERNNKIKYTFRSGNAAHKYLMKESFEYFKDREYKVLSEHKIKDLITDIFAVKGDDKIAIECSVRPTLRMIKHKFSRIKDESIRLMIVYPSSFIPTFPIKNYVDTLTFQVPKEINPGLVMTEIYPEDLQQLHFIKISTNAKNLPDVLHKAIKQMKVREKGE